MGEEKYQDIEEMAFRMELIFDETAHVLDLKQIVPSFYIYH